MARSKALESRRGLYCPRNSVARCKLQTDFGTEEGDYLMKNKNKGFLARHRRDGRRCFCAGRNGCRPAGQGALGDGRPGRCVLGRLVYGWTRWFGLAPGTQHVEVDEGFVEIIRGFSPTRPASSVVVRLATTGSAATSFLVLRRMGSWLSVKASTEEPSEIGYGLLVRRTKSIG